MVIPVLTRVTVYLPLDAEVLGIQLEFGEIGLVVSHGSSLDKSPRYFYALHDDCVMLYPDLGYIDSIFVDSVLWHVFEDDLNQYYSRRR